MMLFLLFRAATVWKGGWGKVVFSELEMSEN